VQLNEAVSQSAFADGDETCPMEPGSAELKRDSASVRSTHFRRFTARRFAYHASHSLHPAEHVVALLLYFLPENKTMTVPAKGGTSKSWPGMGRQQRKIEFPKLSFDTGPFGK
jgi:hypothetical protein